MTRKGVRHDFGDVPRASARATFPKWCLTPFLAAAAGLDAGEIQAPASAPARGEGPYAAVADALAAKLDEHPFVFIGSTHGSAKIEEFLAALVSRPAFQQRATDLLVEWASGARQRLLDRYLLALEEIPAVDLAPIWFDTDAPTLWGTMPECRRFLDALRAANRTLPPAKRIRVVAGNEKIEWEKVRTVEDLAPYPYRTNIVPHLILEHLAKEPGHRTLVVYGDAHIHHKGANFMLDLEAGLERSKTYVVGTIHELCADERAYLAELGDPTTPFFADAKRFPSAASWPASLQTRLNERSERLSDVIDGLVYLGPEPDRVTRGALPLSAAQEKELARRNEIFSDHRRSMQIRFAARDRWFASHPADLPPRP